MLVDPKQIKKMDFISSRRKNGDIIVKFDDDHECDILKRKLAPMNYAGNVASLPAFDPMKHKFVYDDGSVCQVGDVVLMNGCHYILVKSSKIPFLEWLSLDTSTIEDNRLSTLELSSAQLDRALLSALSKIAQISSQNESLLSSIGSLSTYVSAPELSGEPGQILVLSNDGTTSWEWLSSATKTDAVVLGPTPTDAGAEEDAQVGTAQYLVGIQKSQLSSSNPQVYKTDISLSTVQSTISATSEIKDALIKELSGLAQTKTVGKLRDSLLGIYDLVNKL